MVNSILLFTLDSLKAGISVGEISNAMAGFYRLEELNVAKRGSHVCVVKLVDCKKGEKKTAEKTTAWGHNACYHRT